MTSFCRTVRTILSFRDIDCLVHDCNISIADKSTNQALIPTHKEPTLHSFVVIFCSNPSKAVEQTFDISEIWDAMMIMWRHCDTNPPCRSWLQLQAERHMGTGKPRTYLWGRFKGACYQCHSHVLNRLFPVWCQSMLIFAMGWRLSSVRNILEELEAINNVKRYCTFT